MKIYDECHYCSECCIELTVQEDKFLNGLCESCYEEQAAKVAPVVEQVPAERELTNTAFGVPPCEDCGQLPCQCPVDAWWQRPAEIKTFAFEMNGKQYRTRSSLELLG